MIRPVYVPLDWIDHQTKLSAANMDHIELGIKEAVDAIDDTMSNIEMLQSIFNGTHIVNNQAVPNLSLEYNDTSNKLVLHVYIGEDNDLNTDVEVDITHANDITAGDNGYINVFGEPIKVYSIQNGEVTFSNLDAYCQNKLLRHFDSFEINDGETAVQGTISGSDVTFNIAALLNKVKADTVTKIAAHNTSDQAHQSLFNQKQDNLPTPVGNKYLHTKSNGEFEWKDLSPEEDYINGLIDDKVDSYRPVFYADSTTPFTTIVEKAEKHQVVYRDSNGEYPMVELQNNNLFKQAIFLGFTKDVYIAGGFSIGGLSSGNIEDWYIAGETEYKSFKLRRTIVTTSNVTSSDVTISQDEAIGTSMYYLMIALRQWAQNKYGELNVISFDGEFNYTLAEINEYISQGRKVVITEYDEDMYGNFFVWRKYHYIGTTIETLLGYDEEKAVIWFKGEGIYPECEGENESVAPPRSFSVYYGLYNESNSIDYLYYELDDLNAQAHIINVEDITEEATDDEGKDLYSATYSAYSTKNTFDNIKALLDYVYNTGLPLKAGYIGDGLSIDTNGVISTINRNYVCTNYTAMVEHIRTLAAGVFNVGSHITVTATDCPDAVVSEVHSTSVTPTANTEAAIKSALESANGFRCYKYTLRAIEGVKVDTNDFVRGTVFTQATITSLTASRLYEIMTTPVFFVEATTDSSSNDFGSKIYIMMNATFSNGNYIVTFVSFDNERHQIIVTTTSSGSSITSRSASSLHNYVTKDEVATNMQNTSKVPTVGAVINYMQNNAITLIDLT